MTWFAENLAQSLVALGIVLLIVDVAFLGFATFILTFLGGSFVLSGLAMWLGLLPETEVAALWSNVVLTSVLAIGLWKPLQQLQNKKSSTQIDTDFAQVTFTLVEDVDHQGLSKHKYSGIEWRLKSEAPIAQGTLVRVVRTEVGVLWVQALLQE